MFRLLAGKGSNVNSYFRQSISPFYLSQWGWCGRREVQISHIFPACISILFSKPQSLRKAMFIRILHLIECSVFQRFLFSVLQMQSIFPWREASLRANPFRGNIQRILQLYYNGALYADVRCNDSLLPRCPVGSKEILGIVPQSLTGWKEPTY